MKRLIALPLVAFFLLFFNSCDKAKELGGQATELKDTLTALTSKLSGVTDEATAEAAAPELETSASKLDTIAAGLDKLPAPVKEKLKSIVSTQGAAITGAIEKLKAIPAVGAKIGPVLDKVSAALAKFGA
jgi:uncharacterized phage infection (PIP) family protein YhgE